MREGMIMYMDFIQDLDDHLLAPSDHVRSKMLKFIDTSINQYVLKGFDYEPQKELLTLRLLRKSDNTMVVRYLHAKRAIFNVSDGVFLNQLSDALFRLDMMYSK